jgi:hypothetical protein
MFFTFPEDAHWNAERQAVGFGVEIGEYHGVVRVPRRVFQPLLPSRPTPERRVEAYYLQRTRFESIAERKLRRRRDGACQYRHDQGLPRWVHRTPPMHYLDKPHRPSIGATAGSRFNRRNAANWVRIQPALTASLSAPKVPLVTAGFCAYFGSLSPNRRHFGVECLTCGRGRQWWWPKRRPNGQQKTWGGTYASTRAQHLCSGRPRYS